MLHLQYRQHPLALGDPYGPDWGVWFTGVAIFLGFPILYFFTMYSWRWDPDVTALSRTRALRASLACTDG